LSLLLKIQKQNTQTLQLFTMIIQIESLYKSNINAKLDGLGAGTKRSNKSKGKRKRLKGSYLVNVENVSQKQISIIDLNCYQIVSSIQ
jgi:hypothetical protein